MKESLAHTSSRSASDSPRTGRPVTTPGAVVAALFFVAVVGSTLVGTLTTEPRYRATTVVRLLPAAGREIAVGAAVAEDAEGYLEARDRARTQIQLISSRAVREDVVRRYNRLGYHDFDLTEGSLDALGRALLVAPREDTQLVEITVLHPDSAHAAVLADLFADATIDANLGSRAGTARAARAWLDTQAIAAWAGLAAARVKVLAFKQEHDAADIDQEVDGVSARLVALQSARASTATDRILLQSEIDEHQRLLTQGQAATLAGMFDDPGLDVLVKEQAARAAEAADAATRYGEQHPERRTAEEREAGMAALVERAVERQIRQERAELDTLRLQEDHLDTAIHLVEGELLERQGLRGDYADLKAEEDRARRLYASLRDRMSEVELQAESRLTEVRVVDHAVPPTSPATPNLPLNLAVAMAVGTAGSLVLSRWNAAVKG